MSFAVHLSCDRCGNQVAGALVVDKLNPSVNMHLHLPTGWSCTTKADSLELYVLCSECPEGSQSLLPRAPSTAFGDDPTTSPTLRPPPPKKDEG